MTDVPLPSATLDDAVPAVALDAVAQRLAGHWALRGVSFTVAPGELVAIVGHNGSGKTTLLRVIATALQPTRGTGRVYGHDLRRDPHGARAVTAMLTHATGLYDDLTAAENLEFAQRMCGQAGDRAAIAWALERVGMRTHADGRIRSFSSGMQRRVAVARLFLRPARLLLLDEPYNSLDPAGVRLIDDLLAQTRAAGGSALVVLHDLERGQALFDRVMELRDGRLVDVRAGSAGRDLRGVSADDEAVLAVGGL